MNITHVKSHREAHLFEIVKNLIGILVMITLIGNKGYIKSVIAIIIHRLISSKVYVPHIPVTLKVSLFLLHHRSDPCIPDNIFLSDHLPQQILFSYPQLYQRKDPQIKAKNYYYANISALGNKCSVYLPANKPDNLIIDTDMFLKEEDYNILRTQKRHIQNRFIFDLQTALLQMPSVRHNVMHDDKGNFARLKVYKEIYFDGLTKHMFTTSIGDIAEGVMLCLIKFGQFRDSL